MSQHTVNNPQNNFDLIHARIVSIVSSRNIETVEIQDGRGALLGRGTKSTGHPNPVSWQVECPVANQHGSRA